MYVYCTRYIYMYVYIFAGKNAGSIRLSFLFVCFFFRYFLRGRSMNKRTGPISRTGFLSLVDRIEIRIFLARFRNSLDSPLVYVVPPGGRTLVIVNTFVVQKQHSNSLGISSIFSNFRLSFLSSSYKRSHTHTISCFTIRE